MPGCLVAASSARAQRQHGDIDRSIAQIDGVVLAFLDHLHTHCIDEKLRHRVDVRRPVCDMPYLSHYFSPLFVLDSDI